jgi:ElaB/YqjD/DUF883 family membrane-anchored ribosome-binding protein
VNEEEKPLKHMGAQSQHTLDMAAATTPAAVLSREREFDDALAPLGLADDAGPPVSGAGSKVGEAASRAVGKAKDTLRSAADHARQRTAGAVARYTRADPLRAVLIAAGVGALLITVLASMTRSGARAVDRKLRR